jgi:hypothetical protein
MNRSLNSIYYIVTRVPYISAIDSMRYKGRRTRVKRIFPELFRELHKVTLDKLDLILQTSSLGVPTRAANLECVVVQTDYFRVRETSYLPSGATDTTTDVKNAHPRTKGHLRGEIVFVASKGCGERLALIESREVERLGPTILVKLCGAVVVAYTGECE